MLVSFIVGLMYKSDDLYTIINYQIKEDHVIYKPIAVDGNKKNNQ